MDNKNTISLTFYSQNYEERKMVTDRTFLNLVCIAILVHWYDIPTMFHTAVLNKRT